MLFFGVWNAWKPAMPFRLRSRHFPALALAVLLPACSTQPQSVANTELLGSNSERARSARAASRPSAHISTERRIVAEIPRRDRDINAAETTGSTSAPSVVVGGRNFRLCLRGSAECKPEELREDERRSVAHAGKIRNYSACLSGNSSCRTDDLDKDQSANAEIARYNRNLASCMSGSAECRPRNLSPADEQKVFATK
jgi:hypothetical protein